MKKIISIITIALVVLIASCVSEDRFERMNRVKTSVTDESLAQDFNFGKRYPEILRALGHGTTGAQYYEDWGVDNFMRHTGTPYDEENGRDFMSYYVVESWANRQWDFNYNSVMAPALANKKLALSMDLPIFAHWSDIIQVISMSRLTLFHGPLIYSEYGTELPQYNYDSEITLHEKFFTEIDRLIPILKSFGDDETIKKFDDSYGGNLTKWMRMLNTMRLRWAMRIVKVDKDWARREYDKALAEPAGLILTNADNFTVPMLGTNYPAWTYCENWNDMRLGSGVEEVCVGYKDPRIHIWAQRIAEKDHDWIFANEPGGPASRTREWAYKGIAGGIYIQAKDQRIPYSKIGTYFGPGGGGATYRRVYTAAETHFIFAEAALRGWPTPDGKTAKDWYESGVRTSWADWGADKLAGYDVETYLADNTNLPIDYDDPQDPRNSYNTNIKITVKWDDLADPEVKLERIMTQKWLASFQHALEMWSDYRRTGYPKLSATAKNESTEVWGRVQPGDVLMRYPFILAERMNNEAGVEEAKKKLTNGKDLITTPLWIHPNWGGSNF